MQPWRGESGETKPNLADLLKESDVREPDGRGRRGREPCAREAVQGKRGAPGIDQMKTTELESHLQAHWGKIRANLLAGTWVPSLVRRVEIP